MSSKDKIEVTEAITQKTADLSRLEITQEEVQNFTKQLGKVLKYIEIIQEVDVGQIEPLMNPLDQELWLRPDEAKNESEDILKSAPEILYDGYKVPPVL